MSYLAQIASLSADDYLAGEDRAGVKHEYVDGRVYAMAGADEAHVTVAGNVFALLRAHLRGGPCRVYIADMKLCVQQANVYCYPDVFVTCDPADAERRQAKESAQVVIEVLSDSTEGCDRGEKFRHYRRLPTLAEYVLIDPRRRSMEVFSRQEDGWLLRPVPEDGALVIASLDFSCGMEAVYEDVPVLKQAGIDRSDWDKA
jgi:Uma2 family endonuclease